MIKDSRFKFRVWDSALQSYRTDFYVYSTGDLFYHHDNGTVEKMELVTHDRWTIEQCTGLRDQHGTLIFEGDILRYKDFTDSLKELCWSNTIAGFVFDDYAIDKDGEYAGSGMLETIEAKDMYIVGNIHEGVKK